MEIEILSVSGSKPLGKIRVNEDATIKNVKDKIHQSLKTSLYPDRQSIKQEVKGRSLKDETTLKSLNIDDGAKLYLQDLGPQISWKNVFLAEYAGPLFVYLWVYQRPWILYGNVTSSPGTVASLAAACWSVHYGKRLLETLFVHRFSHGTMPLRNLFKNCAYYWLFTLYIAYHINHPLFTEPCTVSVYVGLAGFAICELGNFSIHILLKNLRPPGTKVRRIPVPDGNPFSQLFNFVSCPNYTYEFGSWLFFTVMTKCIPDVIEFGSSQNEDATVVVAEGDQNKTQLQPLKRHISSGIFAVVGLYQMSMWALGKHRNYKKEFPDYPKGRKAILPFIL